MKKKNRFKSWLIGVLHKWLNKLESHNHFPVKVEYTHVPLVTVDASVAIPKSMHLPEERVNEILAKQIGEEAIKYADIEYCEKIDISIFEEQIIYRAAVRVAAEERG